MAYDSSATNRLAIIRDTINTILSGGNLVSYTVAGLQINRANPSTSLPALRQIEKELEAEVAQENRTSPRAAYAKVRKQF